MDQIEQHNNLAGNIKFCESNFNHKICIAEDLSRINKIKLELEKFYQCNKDYFGKLLN